MLQTAARHAVRHSHRTLLPHWLIHLGALGVFGVSLVDASVIPLAIPGSTDLLLMLLVAQRGNPWILAVSALIGSAIGGYLTWSAGRKGGEALLEKMVPKRMLKRVSGWAANHPIASVFLPPLLPPPIPLMPFLLAAGVFNISRRRFLLLFSAARAVRYGLITWAGVVYGRRFVHWWVAKLAGWSDVILWAFIILLIGGVVFGIWQYRRQQRAGTDARAFA